jgi:RNA polymerase-associated protein RTF1
VVDDEEGESSAESGELSDVDVKRVDESSTRITSENVRPITLTREFFSRYCYYPQFESAITGCFTRVRISEKDNDYRFARIEGLVTVSKYSVEGVPVDQGLELSQGGTKKVINMDFASNSPITQVLYHIIHPTNHLERV